MNLIERFGDLVQLILNSLDGFVCSSLVCNGIKSDGSRFDYAFGLNVSVRTASREYKHKCQQSKQYRQD